MNVRAYDWTEGGAFWEVGVPEVSRPAAVQAARAAMDEGKTAQRRGWSRRAAGQSLACRAAFRPPQVPVRGTTSTAPVTELRRNRRLSRRRARGP